MSGKQQEATKAGTGAFRAWSKVWLSDKSTYPIIGVMCGWVGLISTMTAHEIKHPAAKWSASARRIDSNPSADEAEAWTHHAVRDHSWARHHSRAASAGAREADEDHTTDRERAYANRYPHKPKPNDPVNVEISSGLNSVIRKLTGH